MPDVNIADRGADSTSVAAVPDWPSRGYAWYVVFVLSLAYAVSFVDRQVINLLVESLRADLGITDAQIGLLQGLAFGVFYTLLGIPLGRLSDVLNRRNIIVAGAGVWSLMTCFCGLSGSFGQLFAARVGVGVGEGALSPAAMSIIGDYFPAERRSLALSVYVMGTSFGAGIALIVGGFVVTWVSAHGMFDVPLFGRLAPWQVTFLMVGLPSLLLIPLLLSVREPPRRDLLAGPRGRGVPVRDAVAYFWDRRRAYVGHILGMSMVSVFTYGIAAWVPTLFMRVHGWSAQDIGLAYGLITLVFGMAGVVSGGWLAGRLRRAGYMDANWRVMVGDIALLVPCATLAPLASSPDWALALLAVAVFLSTMPYGVAAAALQDITPNQLRAQASALYLFGLGLLGLGLGPAGVGFATEHVFDDPMAVGRSIALVCGIAGPLAIVCLVVGWGSYRRLILQAA